MANGRTFEVNVTQCRFLMCLPSNSHLMLSEGYLDIHTVKVRFVLQGQVETYFSGVEWRHRLAALVRASVAISRGNTSVVAGERLVRSIVRQSLSRSRVLVLITVLFIFSWYPLVAVNYRSKVNNRKSNLSIIFPGLRLAGDPTSSSSPPFSSSSPGTRCTS